MLYIHRAERADRLADALAEVLRAVPEDPFAAEVVAVPARGVERWLTQRLSRFLGASVDRTDGVCANIEFPSPAELVVGAVSAASDLPAVENPWQPRRILWPLLEVITESAGEPWCAALGAHRDAGASAAPRAEPGVAAAPDRLFAAAVHLAALYEAYGAARPAMLRAWAAGADDDGGGDPLDDDLRWQAELWRRVRSRIGLPSPAECLDPACATLRNRPECSDLPSRLSLFGPTRLTTDQLAVLAALGHRRDVHLWLPHPSPALWERIRSRAGQELAVGRGPQRRRTDPSARLPRHPLLASLGRDAREMQVLLGAATAVAETDDRHHSMAARPRTLLGRLQGDLRDDLAPSRGGAAADPRPLLEPADRSVQVHACHGPARQVEVLREVLLGLLSADPSLEPRDILVMCPDIETFAPLISAAFGGGEEPDGAASAAGWHPAHQLRVRLADRSLRQTNPLLATLARLLELADARITASQVLDLAASAPVRRRFGLDDEDLDQLRTWVARAGIRWGLDAQHRAPFRLQNLGQNTWQAGLDRILLGAAMAEDDQRWLGLALPLDDVDSADIDLAGRLAELVDRLGTALAELTGDRPLSVWLGSLGAALDALTSVGDGDGWQLAQARRELAAVAEEAGARAERVTLTLAEVRALLADRLRGRPTRANFRTGSLTVCSLVPMRSVPHRVICLLGLDDGVFPRNAIEDGDDVLARDPVVGERDRRSEERQLLLDAVLAAQEHLVLLYTGADERTNAGCPPAVPVGEILDAVDATVRAPDGAAAREQVVVRHPLQPFDARNFTAGSLGAPGAFSFDRPSLAGARAAAGPRSPSGPFLAAPLPPAEDDGTVELADLLRFLEHPVRGFLRQRLDVAVLGEEDEIDDRLRAELDYLQSWAVGDRLLTARLAGLSEQSCRQAEWRRGMLPPGPLGAALLDRLIGEVEPLVAAAAAIRSGEPGSLDVSVRLTDGVRLQGTVGELYDQTLVRVVYSRLGAKHRLRAWLQVLALAASHPASAWQAVTVGRGSGRGARRSTLTGPAADQAGRCLAELIDLYRLGLREPLPLAVRTSHRYAGVRAGGGVPDAAVAAAATEWTRDRGLGEASDPHHELVWGPDPQLSRLLAQPPTREEVGAGPTTTEPTRFGELARRLWDPLLVAETVDVP